MGNLDRMLRMRKLDSQMAVLKRKITQKPAALETVRQEVNRTSQELEQVRAQVKDLQMIVDRRNVELRAAEEQVQKLSQQANSLKTNADFQAMQRQITAKQESIREIEDRVLEGMEVVEKARRELPDRERRVAEQKARLAEQEKKVAEEVRVSEIEVAALQAAWDAEGKDLDPATLDEYQKLRVRYGETALSEVTPEGVCTGCHTRVTSNVLNQALAGHLVACNNCYRWIYSA